MQVQQFPSYKATPTAIMEWSFKKGGLSQGGQFSSILLSECIWNLIATCFWFKIPQVKSKFLFYMYSQTCQCGHLYYKVTFFLSCYRKFHIKRSHVLKGHFFIVPKVNSQYRSNCINFSDGNRSHFQDRWSLYQHRPMIENQWQLPTKCIYWL